MAREIKFRAWNKKLNRLSQPFNLYSLKNGWWLDKENTMDATSFELSDCDIEQFTGLCDKNGKEIYEGDICKYYDYCSHKFPTITEVENLTDFLMRYGLELEETGMPETDDKVWGWEIIGNINENPELIGDAR